MSCLKQVLIVLFLATTSSQVQAESAKIDLLGGISNPAPGLAAGVQACWRIASGVCGGVSLWASHNEQTRENMSASTAYGLGFVEKQWPLGDGYRLMWLHVAAGAAAYQRRVANEDSTEERSWRKWAPAVSSGFGIELPIADLIGFRVGVIGSRALLAGTVTQVALTAGVRFGSEWLGFGE